MIVSYYADNSKIVQHHHYIQHHDDDDEADDENDVDDDDNNYNEDDDVDESVDFVLTCISWRDDMWPGISLLIKPQCWTWSLPAQTEYSKHHVNISSRIGQLES